MVDAKALFKRHSTQFNEIMKATTIEPDGRKPDQYDAQYMAMIYGACIVAEAIRAEYGEMS